MSELRFSNPDDIVISRQEINTAITDMADYYNWLYRDVTEITAVSVLNGAKPFAKALIPLLKPKIVSDRIKVTSMSGTESTGQLKFQIKPETEIGGKDVLVIEDLVDTGLTLAGLYEYFVLQCGAKSVHFAALFEKPECRNPETEIPNLRTGIQVANVFIIGFGMDWNEKYRELPYLTIAKETRPGFWEPVYKPRRRRSKTS